MLVLGTDGEAVAPRRSYASPSQNAGLGATVVPEKPTRES